MPAFTNQRIMLHDKAWFLTLTPCWKMVPAHLYVNRPCTAWIKSDLTANEACCPHTCLTIWYIRIVFLYILFVQCSFVNRCKKTSIKGSTHNKSLFRVKSESLVFILYAPGSRHIKRISFLVTVDKDDRTYYGLYGSRLSSWNFAAYCFIFLSASV